MFSKRVDNLRVFEVALRLIRGPRPAGSVARAAFETASTISKLENASTKNEDVLPPRKTVLNALVNGYGVGDARDLSALVWLYDGRALQENDVKDRAAITGFQGPIPDERALRLAVLALIEKHRSDAGPTVEAQGTFLYLDDALDSGLQGFEAVPAPILAALALPPTVTLPEECLDDESWRSRTSAEHRARYSLRRDQFLRRIAPEGRGQRFIFRLSQFKTYLGSDATAYHRGSFELSADGRRRHVENLANILADAEKYPNLSVVFSEAVPDMEPSVRVLDAVMLRGRPAADRPRPAVGPASIMCTDLRIVLNTYMELERLWTEGLATCSDRMAAAEQLARLLDDKDPRRA